MIEGRVFFLGAGFSAGAGIPLTSDLLPKASKLFENQAHGLYSRVKKFARDLDIDLNAKPGANDFARLCTYLDFLELRENKGSEQFSEDGSRERLALKFFLAKAIAFETPQPKDIPDAYLQFARGIQSNDVVFTFNWDVLLELALNKLGKDYSYSWCEEKTLLLKAHGSINWVNNKPQALRTGAKSLNYKPIGFKEGMVENEVYCSDDLLCQTPWIEAKPLVDELRPMIVLPGYGKAVDVRLLPAIWYRPEFLNMFTGGVSVIGLHVSDDDYFMESLFRYLFRNALSESRPVRIVNPDPAAAQRIVGLNPERCFDVRQTVFSSESVPFTLFRD